MAADRLCLTVRELEEMTLGAFLMGKVVRFDIQKTDHVRSRLGLHRSPKQNSKRVNSDLKQNTCPEQASGNAGWSYPKKSNGAGHQALFMTFLLYSQSSSCLNIN